MSRKHPVQDAADDAADELDAFMDAVNDSQYSPGRASRADILKARRRVEHLLEERRLRQVIDDDWHLDDGEEEDE